MSLQRKDFSPTGRFWLVWILFFFAIFTTAMLLVLA